jgi:hypothetical protein
MFQFPGFASVTYVFSAGYSRSCGFPHSDIHGSKPVRGSPWLFAAYHVLHRLSAPRHPPNALTSLDRSHFSMPGCQGSESKHQSGSADQQSMARHWKDQLQGFASPPSREGVRSGAPRHVPDAVQAHAPRAMARKVKSLLHNVKDLDHQSQATGKSCLVLWVAAFDAERNRRPGGARRDRTDDLLLAKQALSQLSYGPGGGQVSGDRCQERTDPDP